MGEARYAGVVFEAWDESGRSPISQTYATIDIDRAFIRTGDRATMVFRFVQCSNETVVQTHYAIISAAEGLEVFVTLLPNQ